MTGPILDLINEEWSLPPWNHKIREALLLKVETASHSRAQVRQPHVRRPEPRLLCPETRTGPRSPAASRALGPADALLTGPRQQRLRRCRRK